MFIVTLHHMGATFYLRGTIWTAEKDRGDKFASRSNAEFALDKARKFMKAAQFKLARVVSAEF